MINRAQKISGIILLFVLVTVIALALAESFPHRLASVGWHALASVSWVTVSG